MHILTMYEQWAHGNVAPQKSILGLALVRFQPAVASVVGPAGCRTHTHTQSSNQFQSAATQSEVKYSTDTA